MRRAPWMLLGALVACGKHADPPAPEPASTGSAAANVSPRLYTAAELAAFEHGLTVRLAANATRTCPRPVIGAATPGSNTAAMLAIVEPTAALAACLDRVAHATENGDLDEHLVRRDPVLVALDRTCGDVAAEGFSRAAAFASGCSPYQTGVRVERTTEARSAAADLVGIHAWFLAGKGRPKDALLLLARGLAVFQDLGRGHVDLATEMTSNRGQAILIQHAWSIIGDTVPADALDELAAAFDAVIAGAPDFAEALAGQQEAVQLFRGMAPNQPDSWVPPGGWDVTYADAHVPQPIRYTREPRDEAGLVFELSAMLLARQLAACPPGASLAVCHRGLTRAAELATARSTALTDDPVDLRDAYVREAPVIPDPAVRDTMRLATRRAMVETLAIAEWYEPSQYVTLRGRVVSQLAALRLHLEVLRFGAKMLRCPTVIELDAPPFAALVAPPALGDQLAIERRGATIRVSPPAWVDAKAPPWQISCPR